MTVFKTSLMAIGSLSLFLLVTDIGRGDPTAPTESREESLCSDNCAEVKQRSAILEANLKDTTDLINPISNPSRPPSRPKGMYIIPKKGIDVNGESLLLNQRWAELTKTGFLKLHKPAPFKPNQSDIAILPKAKRSTLQGFRVETMDVDFWVSNERVVGILIRNPSFKVQGKTTHVGSATNQLLIKPPTHGKWIPVDGLQYHVEDNAIEAILVL